MKIAQAQFSIAKALQFVGDNSTYQKTRMAILGFVIMTFAILNSQLPLISPSLGMFFLVISGLGQMICPVYMALKTMALGLFSSCIIATLALPFSQTILDLALLSISFFGRGFYVGSLIYLNEIGGQKFRAWSCIAIFGIWGIAPLILALQNGLKLSIFWWLFLFAIIPFLVGSVLVMIFQQKSPYNFYMKKMYKEAKMVLNDMAKQNKRPYLPFNLEGQGDAEDDILGSYRKLSYKDIISRPVIRRITFPLLLLWMYRQYIYYGSFLIVPQLGEETSKNLILLSVSETVAALMSYPIKLKIKRVNAFFGFTLVITVSCLIASFLTIHPECMPKGSSCPAKHIYRLCAMIVRFSISLIGSILINYTLQLYPSNIRNLGFSLAIGVGSIGSLVMPWFVQGFIYFDLSGFISFFLAGCGMLYVISTMEETNGKMRNGTVEELQNNTPMINFQSWTRIGFGN